MTIQNRELNRRLGFIERCAEVAPLGTHEEAKRAAACINECAEAIIETFKRHGFQANSTDPMRDIEAALYGFLCYSNPNEAYGLKTGEGFGEHIDGPAGDYVLTEAIRERDFINRVLPEARRIMGIKP